MQLSWQLQVPPVGLGKGQLLNVAAPGSMLAPGISSAAAQEKENARLVQEQSKASMACNVAFAIVGVVQAVIMAVGASPAKSAEEWPGWVCC